MIVSSVQTGSSLRRTLSSLGTLFTSPELTASTAAVDAEAKCGPESEGWKGKPGPDSDSDAGSPSPNDWSSSQEDLECGVCLDQNVEVAFSGCAHKLCLECARNLTRQDKRPPNCPFCRQMVTGFQRVPSL